MILEPEDRQRLERLLAAHEPGDAAERVALEHISAFVRSAANPFDRSDPSGHLTGSALVTDGAGRVLLAHHRGLNLWTQLGGHANSERSAAEVALREAREESGLADLTFHPALSFEDGSPRLLDVDVFDVPARGQEPRHQHLDLRFALTTASPERIVLAEAEAHALEWLEPAEAARRSDPGLGRAIQRLVGLSPDRSS